jgi:hypothetical protein
MQDRLFDIPVVEDVDGSCGPSSVSHQVIGKVAELRAEENLWLRGHKVAHPGTDEDGVDLIVNYRIAVQVKATSSSQRPGQWLVGLNSMRASERSVKGTIRDHVDVLLVHAFPINAWWCIPRSALNATNGYQVSGLALHEVASSTRGNAQLLSSYRDRWDIFEYPDNFGLPSCQ